MRTIDKLWFSLSSFELVRLKHSFLTLTSSQNATYEGRISLVEVMQAKQ